MSSSSSLKNLIHKADALVASNNLNEALAAYKKICKIDSTNPSAWLAFGSIAGNAGKFKDAEIAFKKAANLQNNNGIAVELLAQAQEAQGENTRALETLLPYRSKGNTNPDILLRIAILHGKTGDFHRSIQCLTEYIGLNTANPNAFHALASAYEAIGDFDNADKNYRQTINLSPGSFNLHNSYGAMLHKNCQWEQALQQYKYSLEYKADNPVAHYNIASLYYVLGYYENAARHHNIAIKYRPDFLESIIGLGKSNRSLGNYEESIKLYKSALLIKPDNSEAYANMGLAYASLSKFDDALKYLIKADEMDPDNVEIICEIASLYEHKGEFIKAEKLLRPLLTTHSAHFKVVKTYGILSKNINEQDAAAHLLEEAIKSDIAAPPVKAELHYLLGKLYNDKNCFDTAFEHYRQANCQQPDTYNRNETLQSVERRIFAYTKESLSALPNISSHEETPIFIIGMPRSGTTLIEQIIASHSNVHGAGELQYLTKVSNELQKTMLDATYDTSLLSTIKSSDLEALASEYLKLSRLDTQEELYSTDKMPHNFLLLGIIQVLFPNARIIHSRRNPIDNCLSIYFSDLNALHPYAGKLENIAEYYTEYYLKLMAHWEQTLDIEMLNIDYEELVTHQENVSKRIIEYCGLEWEDNCLKYYETGRNVTTISYDQVRKPIYKSSMERWRNYSNHIDPLLKHFG